LCLIRLRKRFGGNAVGYQIIDEFKEKKDESLLKKIKCKHKGGQ